MSGLAYLFLWVFVALFLFFLVLVFFLVYNESSRAEKELLARRALICLVVVLVISSPFLATKLFHSATLSDNDNYNNLDSVSESESVSVKIKDVQGLERIRAEKAVEIKRLIEAAYDAEALYADLQAKIKANKEERENTFTSFVSGMNRLVRIESNNTLTQQLTEEVERELERGTLSAVKR